MEMMEMNDRRKRELWNTTLFALVGKETNL